MRCTPTPGTIIRGTMRAEDLIPAFHAELARVIPLGTRLDPPLPEWGWIEVEALIDDLNTYAPEGLYFGAHPGDGADWGWWATEN